jgi:hypothetical protein
VTPIFCKLAGRTVHVGYLDYDLPIRETMYPQPEGLRAGWTLPAMPQEDSFQVWRERMGRSSCFLWFVSEEQLRGMQRHPEFVPPEFK